MTQTDASERYAELGKLAEAVKFAPGNEWFTAADLVTYASQKYGDVILADDAAYIAAIHPQAILALLADNTALMEALEPFATEAARWIEMGDTRPIADDTDLTVGDLRRAALASALPETKENNT